LTFIKKYDIIKPEIYNLPFRQNTLKTYRMKKRIPALVVVFGAVVFTAFSHVSKDTNTEIGIVVIDHIPTEDLTASERQHLAGMCSDDYYTMVQTNDTTFLRVENCGLFKDEYHSIKNQDIVRVRANQIVGLVRIAVTCPPGYAYSTKTGGCIISR
jgi:hypothetical protein